MSFTQQVSQEASPEADQELTAVPTRVLQQLERAWNAGDGAAFAEPFGEACDFVEGRGGHHRGRVAVAAGLQAIFGSIYRGSTVDYRLQSARRVAPSCLVSVA